MFHSEQRSSNWFLLHAAYNNFLILIPSYLIIYIYIRNGLSKNCNAQQIAYQHYLEAISTIIKCENTRLVSKMLISFFHRPHPRVLFVNIMMLAFLFIFRSFFIANKYVHQAFCLHISMFTKHFVYTISIFGN